MSTPITPGTARPTMPLPTDLSGAVEAAVSKKTGEAQSLNQVAQSQLEGSQKLQLSQQDATSRMAAPKVTVGPGEAKQILEGAGIVLPSDTPVDIYAAMALMQKLAQEMRNANREVRTAELQASVTSLMDAAQQMKDAAALRLASGIVSGALQVAGGALQVGAGAFSMVQGGRAAAAQAKAEPMANQAKFGVGDDGAKLSRADRLDLQNKADGFNQTAGSLTRQANMADAVGKGGSQIGGGVGQIVSSILEHQAALKDAKKAELEAQSKKHDAAYQGANEMMQQMLDVIRDIREKLQSIDQARVETNKTISRNV